MENALQVVNGHLSEIEELCITHAIATFKKRKLIDTNPRIVQMIHFSVPIDHWYYRSNEWIDQPYFIKSHLIQPHIGAPEFAMPLLYGENTYQPDEKMTILASKS